MRKLLTRLRAWFAAGIADIRIRWNPFLITTIYGLRDRRQFERRDFAVNNDNEHTTVVEYWDGTTLVHRSAHVRLKKMPQFAQTEQGGLQ